MTTDNFQNEAGSSRRIKKALGRGIEALIPDIDPASGDVSGEYFTCDIRLIRPNPFQPRIRFSREELDELSRSIQEQGILQPLLVRKAETGYELIAGERRLRAARIAGMNTVPVVVKNVSDGQLLEISIIENIQRQELNALEEAEAYHRLMDEFHLTQEEVAIRVGKSRSAIANFLRLRMLPEPIKADILNGVLSMGHARALLGADTTAQQHVAWKAVVAKSLSVRETEALVKRLRNQKPVERNASRTSVDVYLSSLADDLSQGFGTRVHIRRKGHKGRVEIEFYDDDDLNRLIGLLKRA